MQWRKPVLFYKPLMKFCAVAFVEVKTIFWKLLMEARHFFVAADFGENGRRGYKRYFFVASYDCLLI